MNRTQRLEEQANLLFDNVVGWENSTLERIGKRINKYGKLSLADVKSINNIAVVKQDMDAIVKELAKVTGYNISQIEQMYGELITQQHLENQPLYDYRNKVFVPFKDNRQLQAIVRAYAKTTAETMVNLAKTNALCIIDAKGNTIGLQKYYTDVLDKAIMQVTTGATDFHTAMRDSIKELGGSGIRVDYGGGVTRRLDTVVRQNMLWGAKQASIEYNNMIGEELGCDGIEIDWHSNPRPSHEFMQGKQYVLGEAKTINDVRFESAKEALERLQDYGCLHFKTPIICGVSEPRYSPKELKRLNEQNAKVYNIDGKEYSGYEATQQMRRLESAIRNEKTTRNLAMASGDKSLVKECNRRINAYNAKYNEISNVTGIAKQPKRMSVPKDIKTINSKKPTTKEIKKIETQIKFGGIENSYAKKHLNAMEQQLKNSPQNIKDVWNDCSSGFRTRNPSYRGKKAYYSKTEDAVTLNINDTSKGNEFSKPYQTAFHEYGHNADYVLNRKYGDGDRYKAFSETYKNGVFGKTLREEATKAIDDFAETLVEKVDADEIRKGFEDWVKSGLMTLEDVENEVNMALLKSQKPERKVVEKMFCEKINKELELFERSDISDMFEPVMETSYPFGFGHGRKYWQLRDSGKEGFAEMFSASVSNPESLKQIKKFFPKSYKIFQEMLEVIK